MALVVALNKAIYFDLVFNKGIEVFFLLDQVTTPLAKRTIIENRLSCILITSLIYKRKTIKNIPINLILMFNAKISNSLM